MYKKIQNFDTYYISKEEYLELCKQPAAQQIVEAVCQYNELVTHVRYVERKDDNPLTIKEVEENKAKAFLDGVFDIIEKKE